MSSIACEPLHGASCPALLELFADHGPEFVHMFSPSVETSVRPSGSQAALTRFRNLWNSGLPSTSTSDIVEPALDELLFSLDGSRWLPSDGCVVIAALCSLAASRLPLGGAEGIRQF